MTDDLATLRNEFRRTWVCMVVRSGRHNGAGCNHRDPHGGDWHCGYRWEMSLPDTAEIRRLVGDEEMTMAKKTASVRRWQTTVVGDHLTDEALEAIREVAGICGLAIEFDAVDEWELATIVRDLGDALESMGVSVQIPRPREVGT